MAKVLIGNFKGPKGEQGVKGDPGTAASIQVGTTQTIQPEENAEVTNSGTTTAAVLNFKIPRGEDGMTDLTAEYKDASEYTCQPTVNAPVVVKGLDGKTEQVETTGVQMINPEEIAFDDCTFVDDKEYTIKSNINNNYYCCIRIGYLNEYILQNKGKSLTFSCKGNPSNKSISIVIFGTLAGGDTYQEISLGAGKNNVTLTISNDFESVSRIELRFNRDNNAPFTDTATEISNIMLNEGTEALPFEPYTGGSPAPSPDYPQVIKGVGGMGCFDGAWRQGAYQEIDGVASELPFAVCNANKMACNPSDNIKIKYYGDTNYIVLVFYKSDGTYLSGTNKNVLNEIAEYEYVVPANASYFNFSIQNERSKSITPSTAKYCTVTINGRYQTGVEVHGAQLFDYSKWAGTPAYRGEAKYVDNSVVLTATQNDCYTVYEEEYEGSEIDVIPGKQYTFSWEYSGAYGYVYIFPENENYINATNSDKKITFTAGENTSYVRFRLGVSNAGETAVYKNIMFNIGPEPLPWEPYHHTAISIPLTSPLYEGDKICYVNPGESYVDADGTTVVADRILYGCYRENGKVVFDGSEDEVWRANGIGNRYNSNLNNSNNKYTENTAECNFFKYNTNVYLDNDDEIGFIITYSTLHCRFGSASDINSVSALKTWLQSNPLTVLYKLAQPYFEPFVDQTPFYNLRSFDNLTYIYSDDPLNPTLTVDVAKNQTGGYIFESLAQAMKNAIAEANSQSRLSAIEQQLVNQATAPTE